MEATIALALRGEVWRLDGDRGGEAMQAANYRGVLPLYGGFLIVW